MNEFEISKPVGIAVGLVTVILVAAGIWFATGRQGDPTKPATNGVPAIAGPAMTPPDAGGATLPPPGAAAMAPAPIPR